MASMLQAYQAQKLQDLHVAQTKEDNPTQLLDKAHRMVNFDPTTIQHSSRYSGERHG